jgi:hypothetical protein
VNVLRVDRHVFLCRRDRSMSGQYATNRHVKGERSRLAEAKGCEILSVHARGTLNKNTP